MESLISLSISFRVNNDIVNLTLEPLEIDFYNKLKSKYIHMTLFFEVIPVHVFEKNVEEFIFQLKRTISEKQCIIKKKCLKPILQLRKCDCKVVVSSCEPLLRFLSML